MKATIDLSDNDQIVCYNRMWAEVTNPITSASGSNANMLRCRAIATENMTRHAKTGLGVSKSSYSGDLPSNSRLAQCLNKEVTVHPSNALPSAAKDVLTKVSVNMSASNQGIGTMHLSSNGNTHQSSANGEESMFRMSQVQDEVAVNKRTPSISHHYISTDFFDLVGSDPSW